MQLRRREFLGSAVAAGVAAAVPDVIAQGPAGGEKTPVYQPKMELLWKAPDRYPNALEASPEGLWLGDQVSERINLLDWKTGKVLQDFIGEAHNTSGLGVGGGHIWVGCNGSGTAAALRPFNRPFDRNYGEIVKLDMKGKQVKGYRTPWGSQHGVTFAQETNTIWAVSPGFNMLVELDPDDDLRVLRMIGLRGVDVPHGVDYDSGFLWVIAAAGRIVQKIEASSGRVVEIWKFGDDDPDPHGMCYYQGHIYFTDAGLGGGRTPSRGTKPQTIFRFPVKT